MANGPKPQRNTKRALFIWGSELLSMALAIVSTVFIVGPIYGATVDWVQTYIVNQYGSAFAGVAAGFWFIAVAVISFGFVSLVFIIFINVKGRNFFSRR
ncbi:MAG: hypothetical protein COA43_04860 [Robiginitomaculum sp.]|nr:MAG: hypothetical protein COA43_04860 [Robiginitomaculum sp.]